MSCFGDVEKIMFNFTGNLHAEFQLTLKYGTGARSEAEMDHVRLG